MKNNMRSWHNWVSVALGLPLLLVGLTTFFIAHEKRLGTKEILLPMGDMASEPVEIRASAQIGSDNWLSTKQGVFRLDGNRAVPIEGGPKDEIRDMATGGDAVLLAGKKGLWRYAGGQFAQVHKADCWQVTASESGYTAACKDVGLLASSDGKQWQARAVQFPAQTMAADEGGMPLSKIIMDIHTGKLFLGKQFEWIWIDLLGFACVALGLTGLVMWMRGRRQRAELGG